ncbi:MAG: response regulator transcription factor [Chlorobiaceae bacterium]|nr:response regulator transcription factor [Chlorobiaceae bacterium]
MLLRKHRVTLVIADHPLLFKDSMDELQKMIGDHPDTSHLVLTSDISKAIFKELSQAGVRNIALKTDDQREIVLGVQAALAGRNHYSRDVLDLLLRSDGQTPDGLLLTPTESEIVPLICGGLSVKDIAERKQVGVRSVMAHRKSIYRKLGVTNAIELKRFAIRAGLIDNIEYHI